MPYHPGELVNAYDNHDDAAKRFGTLKSFREVHRMKFGQH